MKRGGEPVTDCIHFHVQNWMRSPNAQEHLGGWGARVATWNGRGGRRCPLVLGHCPDHVVVRPAVHELVQRIEARGHRRAIHQQRHLGLVRVDPARSLGASPSIVVIVRPSRKAAATEQEGRRRANFVPVSPNDSRSTQSSGVSSSTSVVRDSPFTFSVICMIVRAPRSGSPPAMPAGESARSGGCGPGSRPRRPGRCSAPRSAGSGRSAETRCSAPEP